jgi:hypothetical protein
VTRQLAAALGVAVLAASGCGRGASGTSSGGSPTAPLPRALVAQSRPVGRGPRFQPPVRGHVLGGCRTPVGLRVGVHVELFAANRVVIVPTGLGTLPPRATLSGRITAARCYGDPVTLEPTGLVLVRPGAHRSLSELFSEWGQPLSANRLGPFSGRVHVFVGGRPWQGTPATVPLSRHAVIVLEVGPHVPPHRAYRFPPGT